MAYSCESMSFIILVASILAVSCRGDDSRLETEIVRASADGVNFEVPYYEAGEGASDPEIIKFSVDAANQAIDSVIETIDHAIKRSPYFYYDEATVGGWYFKTRDYRIKEKTIYDPKSHLQLFEFEDKMLSIIPDLMEQSSKKDCADNFLGCFGLGKSTRVFKDKLSRKQAYQRLKLIFGGIRKLVEASPVGLHLDFTRMKIDNHLMVDEVRELFRFMALPDRTNILLRHLRDYCLQVKEAVAEDLEAEKSKV